MLSVGRDGCLSELSWAQRPVAERQLVTVDLEMKTNFCLSRINKRLQLAFAVLA